MVHRQLHTLHVYYFEWYVLELLYVIIQTREKKSENTENNVLYQAILYMLGDGRLPSYYLCRLIFFYYKNLLNF